jgi:hypothetical protein
MLPNLLLLLPLLVGPCAGARHCCLLPVLLLLGMHDAACGSPQHCSCRCTIQPLPCRRADVVSAAAEILLMLLLVLC